VAFCQCAQDVLVMHDSGINCPGQPAFLVLFLPQDIDSRMLTPTR